MAAEDPDLHRRDLWQSLENGKQAAWTLQMQVMAIEDAVGDRFNPFDLTKIWPHRDSPMLPVGRLILNRNPGDHFAEVEQSAFEPSNMVPGIEPGLDRMLLGRMFSDPDAHRYRIGTNDLQLPINRPRNAVHSYAKDGAMRIRNPGDPVYAPTSQGGPRANGESGSERHRSWSVGELVRAPCRRHPKDDDFVQPRALIDEVLNPGDAVCLVANVVAHARQGVPSEMREGVTES